MLLEHYNDLTLLKWPPPLPDISVTELLWYVLEQKMHIMDVQLENLVQLQDGSNSRRNFSL